MTELRQKIVIKEAETKSATSQTMPRGEPILTASQEEYILNELSIEQSNRQQTVNNFSTELLTFK